MIKQAHSYLVGALSGVTVIGVAIAVFVVLVSAQVFHELPIVNVSSPESEPAAISPAKAVHIGTASAATTGKATHKARQPRGAAEAGAIAATPSASSGRGHNGAVSESPAPADETAPATAVESSPSTGGGKSTHSGGSSGSHQSQPSSGKPSPNPAPSPGAGTPSSSGASGSSSPTGSSGGGTTTGTGGSGGASGGGSTPPAEAPVAATTKPSQAISETVNGTVGVVNEATGGALEETGVTEVTEKVVENVAGPESVAGKTVDGVAEAVNGLLGSGSH